MLLLVSACGTTETAVLEGFVVSDASTAITLQSDPTREHSVTTEGKNMVHLLVTVTDSARAEAGRVAIVKIEDKKGANLKVRDGIKLLCKVDTGESVGGTTAGFEFDDCRLTTPYTDFTWDGFSNELERAIERYNE